MSLIHHIKNTPLDLSDIQDIIANNKKIALSENVIEKINDDKYPILVKDLGFLALEEMPEAFAKEITKVKKGKFSKLKQLKTRC